MKKYSTTRSLLEAALGTLLLATFISMGCSSTPKASAVQVTSRRQLIGGQRALGEIGDFKLSNGLIHAIIQDVGHSRGFGAFGGSLIDLDLVRGGSSNGSTGGNGNDEFTELFPAFFLEAIEPSKVEVTQHGSSGPAVVRVSGKGGHFLSLTKPLNETLFGNEAFNYQVDYILEPGKQYLKIVTTLTNASDTNDFNFLFSIPLGMAAVLGEGQRFFLPGKTGYDSRFSLQDIYRNSPAGLEALPGIVTPMFATEGQGVSYALAASPRGATYMKRAREQNPLFYPDAKNDSLLIPISSGGLVGSYWASPPPTLGPKKSFSYTAYLAVGTGDVASAQKIIYGISDEGGRQPAQVGMVVGHVREKTSHLPVSPMTVVFQNEKQEFVSSATTTADGFFSAPLPPGNYSVTAVDSTRTPVLVPERLKVEADAMKRFNVEVDRASTLVVQVRDDTGRPLPAKVSVVGTYEGLSGKTPREFLYNLPLGERMRVSDFVPDDASEANTRAYLEKTFFLNRGAGGQAVRPGKYRVYVSRGMEYDVASQEVELTPGAERKLEFVLRQVLPTPGYISADFHVHSINSVDSNMALDARVLSYAAEGVDYLVSTDHNYVSDFSPMVEALRLQDFVKTSVGLELTTLEMGHFNAFPLKYQPGPMTHGAFRWFQRAPGDLFAQLRSLGTKPEETLVQVNHPRDSLMGYFNAFNLNSYSMQPMPPTSAFALEQTPLPNGDRSPYDFRNFSFDFDLLEVFNSKRRESMWHYRIPEKTPDGPAPTLPNCSEQVKEKCIPAPLEILENTYTVKDANSPGGSYTYRRPVYPGALEDFYMMTAKGYQKTAVGNSDSHSATSEAGYPRTYVYVGPTADGSMLGLKEEAVREALKAHKAFVTNGPVVEMWVNDAPVGSEVVSLNGDVRVRVKVQAAPWVDVSKVILKRGGREQLQLPQILKEIGVAPAQAVVRLDETYTFQNLPDDSFLVAEVHGEKSLWPVVTPNEFRSVPITEAVSSFGSVFGLNNDYGRYYPNEAQLALPFAFTNPIWVRRSPKQPLKAQPRILSLETAPSRGYSKVLDLRHIFSSLHSDEE